MPLIAVRAYGMLGAVRLQVRCLEIVESKPDNVVWDLRLREPFPELERAADALDLDALDRAGNQTARCRRGAFSFVRSVKRVCS